MMTLNRFYIWFSRVSNADFRRPYANETTPGV